MSIVTMQKEKGRAENMKQIENYFQITDPGKEETTLQPAIYKLKCTCYFYGEPYQQCDSGKVKGFLRISEHTKELGSERETLIEGTQHCPLITKYTKLDFSPLVGSIFLNIIA